MIIEDLWFAETNCAYISHPTSNEGTWVQIPLRANFLSNLLSVRNIIICVVQGQGFSHELFVLKYN